jgi:predicted ATPase/DNA-binding winged helix-turn-helix (wHTH) protein
MTGRHSPADNRIHVTLQFGPFELSSRERLLRRDGVMRPLGSRALDILIYLAERPCEVIVKQELIDNVWPGVTVEEGTIRVHLAAIRKALGDGQFGNRYITNIKGRGYSFIGTVVRVADGEENRDSKFSRRGRPPMRPLKIIGRDSMLNEVKDSLREQRFVSLVGPGGIGKTTIAVAVGHAVAEVFGKEIYFVDLASLADPDHVVQAVGTSIGFVLKSDEPSLELVDLIRSRKLLIILDNCEHVIKAAASIAEQLFQGAGQVHLLATSRELLRVEGEYCYRVEPLDFPPTESEQTADAVTRYPAVQLFVERVAARGSNFVLNDRVAPFVADMCRKLDGVPLAIELAAGPAAVFGIDATLARLSSRLDLLKRGYRTAVPRHQTLKATLDWSYDLLSEMERIVLRRIARFVGQFSLEGATQVTGYPGSDDGEIFDAVAGLVEKSLIATRFDRGEVHYRLLDTTRAYALERLEEHGEFDPISLRHAEYVIQHLESKKEMPSTLPRAERLAAYSWQLSNVRSALEWSFGSHGSDEIATRLTVSSTRLFMELALTIEWRPWAERALARLEDQHEEQDIVRELTLLDGLFLYSSWTTDIHRALDIAARSQKAALKTQDSHDMAATETMAGFANHLAGNHVVAQGHFEAGLRYLASGSRLRAGHHLYDPTSGLLVGMARCLMYRGELGQSLDYARLAIGEAEKSGDPERLCRVLIVIVPVYQALEDWLRVEECITQMTDVSAAHSLKSYHAIATGFRGRWLLLQNNIHDGVALLTRASEELEAQGGKTLNMDFVSDLGAGLAASGRHQEALTLVVNALAAQERGGKLINMPSLMKVKGFILASRSPENYPEAEQSLLSSIGWARRQSAALFELQAAMDLAELLQKQGRLREAYKYLSAALDHLPGAAAFPLHGRALEVLDQLRSVTNAMG